MARIQNKERPAIQFPMLHVAAVEVDIASPRHKVAFAVLAAAAAAAAAAARFRRHAPRARSEGELKFVVGAGGC